MKSKSAVRGVIWSAFQRFSTQGIGFIISIILARLLSPADYGIISLSIVFLVIFRTINESGFSLALINKQNRDEVDYSSVFIINVLTGFFLYILLFFTADLIAAFFHNEKLAPVLRIVGLCTIIDAFSIVQTSIFTISLNFKIQAKASVIAVILSGISGIYLAYNNFAFWALVVQSILYSIINAVLLWHYSIWKPTKLIFSFQRIRSLFDYSYKLVLARLVNTIFLQLYSIVIGHAFSVELLGLFNKAKQFETQTSSNIANIVMRVSIPLMCEVQDDYNKLAGVLKQFTKATAFIVFPLLIGIIVLAKPLILVLLTDKWIETVWILQILCFTGLFYILTTFNINVFNATGRTGLALQSEVLKKTISFLIMVLSIFGGFECFVWSQLVISMVEMFISMYYTKKQIGLNLWGQFSYLKNIFLSSIIMGGVVWLITDYIESEILKLFLGFIVGVIVYFLYWCFVDPSYLISLKKALKR